MQRCFHPASIWETTGNPQVQYHCAHFRGEETKALSGTDVPKLVAKPACGLVQDKRGERI